MAISGVGVAYATAGGILLWSGLKGQKVSDLVQSITKGNLNAPVTESLTGQGIQLTGSFGSSSASATTAAANTSADTAATGVGATGPAPGADTSIQNYNTARLIASTYGWGTGQEWASLTHVINAESGGNPTARNASGAYGIAQALGHGTANTAGSSGINEYGNYGVPDSTSRAANSGNASAQLVWMMAYIKSRWGDPNAAWTNEQANHWY